jgi:hypothetical protein
MAAALYAAWLDMVQQYSSRHLTRETDRFMAIDGFAQLLSRILEPLTGKAHNLFSGIWDGDIFRGLLWHVIPSPRQKSYRIHLEKYRNALSTSGTWQDELDIRFSTKPVRSNPPNLYHQLCGMGHDFNALVGAQHFEQDRVEMSMPDLEELVELRRGTFRGAGRMLAGLFSTTVPELEEKVLRHVFRLLPEVFRSLHTLLCAAATLALEYPLERDLEAESVFSDFLEFCEKMRTLRPHSLNMSLDTSTTIKETANLLVSSLMAPAEWPAFDLLRRYTSISVRFLIQLLALDRNLDFYNTEKNGKEVLDDLQEQLEYGILLWFEEMGGCPRGADAAVERWCHNNLDRLLTRYTCYFSVLVPLVGTVAAVERESRFLSAQGGRHDTSSQPRDQKDSDTRNMERLTTRARRMLRIGHSKTEQQQNADTVRHFDSAKFLTVSLERIGQKFIGGIKEGESSRRVQILYF